MKLRSNIMSLVATLLNFLQPTTRKYQTAGCFHCTDTAVNCVAMFLKYAALKKMLFYKMIYTSRSRDVYISFWFGSDNSCKDIRPVNFGVNKAEPYSTIMRCSL